MMPGKAAILCLNDDCLLRIFSMLNLTDEKRMSGVCTRFYNLILFHWSLKYRAYRRVEKMYKTAELKWIVRSLGSFVEELDLGDVTRKELQYLEKCGFIFPYTRKLRCRLFLDPFIYYDSVDDVDLMRIVSHTFPDLTHLSVTSIEPMDLLPIRGLRNLIALELQFNTPMRVTNFKVFADLQLKRLKISTNSRLLPFEEDNDDNVLQILNCTTIEELHLGAGILKLVASDLQGFPKLRQVACVKTNFDGVFGDVLIAIGKRAIEVISSPWINSFSLIDLQQLKNVDMLKVYTHHLYKFNRSVIAAALGNLRKLHFMNKDNDMFNANPSSQLLSVVTSCSKLEILAVPFTWVNKYISIAELVRILEQQTDRKVPLQLRCVLQKKQPDYIKGFENVPLNSKVLRLITTLYSDPPGFDGDKWFLSFQVTLRPDGDI